MDMAQAFIFAVGWVFFAALGMVLVAVSAIAFSRDILTFTERAVSRKARPLTGS